MKNKNENIKNSDLDDLYQQAENEIPSKIIEILESNFNLSNEAIDNTFRIYLRNFPKDRVSIKDAHISCLKTLLDRTTNINFQNTNENNTTILMEACSLWNQHAVDLIIPIYAQTKSDLSIIDNKQKKLPT